MMRTHRWPHSIKERPSCYSQDSAFEDPAWQEETHNITTRAYSFYQGRLEIARVLMQVDMRTQEERDEVNDEVFVGTTFPHPLPAVLLGFFEVRRSYRGRGIGTEIANLIEHEYRRTNMFLVVETTQAFRFWLKRGWEAHPAPAWAAPYVLAALNKPGPR